MSNENLNSVTEFTPNNVGNRLYSIPLYQRLYAWESDQVKQLLDDLHDNYIQSIDNPRQYFIGNIVVSSADKQTQRNALIDGQQRMTTFWLMGFVLKEHHPDWKYFIQKDDQLRLDFIARDEDRIFLKMLSETNINEFREKPKVDGINPVMINAINEIWTFVNSTRVMDKSGFSKYIYEQTKIVEVALPGSTDLNKYFEIMNNRGIQLEKHEILKARLIEKIIDTHERIRYAAIWDACAQMNQHIERCFEKSEEKEEEQLVIKKEISDLIKNNFHNIEAFIQKLTSGSNQNEKTFQEIVKEAEDQEKFNETLKNQNRRNDEGISSIVNFPSFLLHVYKIWHKDFNVSLKDKDLLKIIRFEKKDKEQDDLEAKSFIREVLIMRILFDQYIIKSYKNGANNLWEIQILAIDGDENKRKKDFENSTQILSMLNVSTSLEHWFTPVLKYLREVNTIEDKIYTNWLEMLDNRFAFARLNDSNKMMGVAKELLDDIHQLNKPKYEIKINSNILSRGTDTDRYWFYKLDYCLWKKWSSDENEIPWKAHIKGFQFRSNRSIEHVYPQHPENGNKWESQDLNSFGNLALISVSSNSSYNCQLPDSKKFDFEKRVNSWGIESLKLADIYRRAEWDQDVCQKHQDEMIQILNDYHLENN